MAVHKTNNVKINVNGIGVEGNTCETNTDTNTGQQQQQKMNAGVSVLGLATMDQFLISNFNDNEILEQFVEVAKKALQNTKLDIKLFKINKDTFDLGYSHVVFAHKGEDNNVYYFSALLEKTGREPLTVHQIVESFNIKNSSDVLVTADAFDNDFYEKVSAILRKAFSTDDNRLVPCEGVVVPATANLETTGDIVARFAHDVIATKYLPKVGKTRDIAIVDIVNYAKGGSLTLDLAFNNGISINMLGRSIRSDFNIETSIVKNTNIRSLNGQGGRKKLTTASGYCEYIISEETNPYTGQVKRVAEPMIVLNEFLGLAPTLNYALLSIVNGSTFTNRSILKNLIIEKDAGPLNFLFNYGGEPNKYGEKISFKDPNANPEVVADIIRQHIKPTPIFAIEVEEFGADYPFMVPFAALVDPGARPAASADILNAAANLVGQPFQSTEIAANEGMFIPLGEFMDSEGNLRDIREINTAFIAKHTNEPSLLIDWVFSNAPASVCMSATGKDPYVVKLEVIDKLAAMLNIKPVITGRAVRIPLSAMFVDELVTKAMSAGYQPRTEAPIISFNDFNNLQNIANAYANAQVSTSGFGIQTTQSGFNMPGVMAYGYRR